MATIIVRTQEELNSLPRSFEERTIIEVRSEQIIVINSSHMTINSVIVLCDNSHAVLWGNSRAELRDNSSAVLRDNSSAVLWDNSHAELWDNSHAVLWGNSHAVLWGNSRAELRDNSSAVLRDNSSAVLWGNSHAVLRDNSRGVLWGNSHAVLRDNSRGVLCDNSRGVLWDNSHAELWDNSHAVLWGNSTCHAYSNSEVTAYLASVVFVYSAYVKIKRLYDMSTAKFMCDHYSQVEDKHKTAQVAKKQKELDFETYLERGYVKADGIFQKLISRKKIKDIEIFNVEDNFGKKSFVIKKGDLFSHGEDLKKAKEDLKYKIGNRDTSQFKKWKIDDVKPLDELIQSYRVITGACEFGVKDFCQKQGKLKSKYKISEVIKMTDGCFGNVKYKEFFKWQR